MADLAARIPGIHDRRPDAARSWSRHPGHRISGQGRNVAPQLLAARHLRRRSAPVAALFSIMTKVGIYA